MNTRAVHAGAAREFSERVTDRFAGLVQRAAGGEAGDAAPVLQACAVRVADGLHRGAALRLREAARIGSDDANDIVLRDPGVRAQHAELRRVDGVWGVFDAVDGRAATPIERSQRGRFERCRYGIGAAQIVVSQAQPALVARRRLRGRLARLVAPLLLVLSAALGAAVIVQLVQPASAQQPTGTRNLGAEGFADVNLVNAPGMQTVIDGYVDDAAALTRLQHWIQQQGLTKGSLQVRVGSELAARVREALAAPGLTVEYRPGGAVRVQGTSDSLAVRERLRRLTTDLAHAVRIDDRVAFIEVPDTSQREHPLPVRIVDVMPGENGSFGNGSGARYFAGAVLPDGSEVIAVHAEAIEFAIGTRRITYHLK